MSAANAGAPINAAIAATQAVMRQKERQRIKQIKICDSSTLRLTDYRVLFRSEGNRDSKAALSHFILKQKSLHRHLMIRNCRAAMRPTAPRRPSCAANRKLIATPLVHLWGAK
jgi:hypothetical protein